MSRLFTLTEARALLPEARRLIREAVQGKQRQEQSEARLQKLVQRILMQGGITVDTNAVELWKAQRESGIEAQKQSLERLEQAGILVKDLDVGLIDFPTLYRGEQVLLCYRMDENDIEFWHGVSEGFRGRRLIDREFLDQHRGDSGAAEVD